MRVRSWRLLVAVLLLWVLFAQSVASAPRLSITTDEGLHITSGYSYLRTGDLRLIEEHPPLVKALEAWPLLLLPDLGSPAETTGWEQGNLNRVTKFFLLRYRPFDRLLFSARAPVMLMSLLLGAFVFRWAADLLGPNAGLLALALYAFDPNIVAHSAIAATDLGAACFIFIACYFFWRYLRRPGWSSILLAGVTLGLAEAAKISALMLLPLFGVLWLVRYFIHEGHERTQSILGVSLCPSCKTFVIVLLIAFLTFWAVFGFELRPLRFDIWESPSSGGLKFDLLVPAASYFIPFNTVRSHLDAGRPTFLLGMNSEQGWWYYFPVTFVLKTPLPTLILLVAALIYVGARACRLWRPGERAQLAQMIWRLTALLSFPLIYFAVALVQPFNIGYRHLLPILPFAFVFISQTSNLASRSSGHPPEGSLSQSQFHSDDFRRRAYAKVATISQIRDLPSLRLVTSLKRVFDLSPCLLVSALFIWYVISTVHIFPHYLAYFNEIAGGPANGYKSLVDSNLDWGQTWKELKAYLDARGVIQVKMSVGGSNDPAIYDIAYEPITPMKGAPPVLPSRFNPVPGVYVLSANSYQGVGLADVNSFDWFRHRRPDAQIGYATFVYTVRPTEPTPTWVAQCAAPAALLDEAALTEGLGRADLRLVYFDCSNSWIFPQGAGWYILPYAAAHDPAGFAGKQLAGATLVFDQRQTFDYPPFSVLLRQSPPDLTHLTASGRAAPSDWLPALAESRGTPTSVSMKLSGALNFVGYTLDRESLAPGDTLTLATYWRVVAPPAQPLSILAHLLNDAGQAIATGDGLGSPREQWHAGDVIVQRHKLAIPKDAPAGPYWAQTGVYSLADGARWAIVDQGIVVGDRVLLASIRVGR